MDQSTVYRSLYGHRQKMTRSIKKLCNYAKIDVSLYSDKDPKSNIVLMDALQRVWNGTDEHAQQLSKLLLTAHSCKIECERI
jgi:hypothetical protein